MWYQKKNYDKNHIAIDLAISNKSVGWINIGVEQSQGNLFRKNKETLSWGGAPNEKVKR